MGGAGGDQFRNAPLWGSGAANLPAARRPHFKSAFGDSGFMPAGAAKLLSVEQNFSNPGPTQQQEILDFLRSL